MYVVPRSCRNYKELLRLIATKGWPGSVMNFRKIRPPSKNLLLLKITSESSCTFTSSCNIRTSVRSDFVTDLMLKPRHLQLKAILPR
jgi:hypothetical protein